MEVDPAVSCASARGKGLPTNDLGVQAGGVAQGSQRFDQNVPLKSPNFSDHGGHRSVLRQCQPPLVQVTRLYTKHEHRHKVNIWNAVGLPTKMRSPAVNDR